MLLPLGPILTGSALWILTRSPLSVQQEVLRIIQRLPFGVTPAVLVAAAKWLLGLGIVRYASSELSEVAYNNWRPFGDAHRWKWADEVAVVTGACSGIGEEIAKALARRGVKVVALDMAELPARLEDVIALYIKCDVTDADAVDAAAVEIRSKLKSPSILVNNAGIGHDFPIFEAPPHRVKKLIDVNLTSHWYTCRAFAPDMVKQNKGHIVEIASMSSFVSVGQFADYSATKAGLIALSECLREQLRIWYRSPDVHITNVHPLWVATPLVAYRQELIEKQSGKMMLPSRVGQEVAEQIFRCKGTQLVIPNSHSFLRTTRAWPAWLLDCLKSLNAGTREDYERAMNGKDK